LKDLTAEYVALVLREMGGDKAKAAGILGVSKRSLYRWQKQGLEAETAASDGSG
jgi:transcriptional regulator with PAS, ATPase and Fis domain